MSKKQHLTHIDENLFNTYQDFVRFLDNENSQGIYGDAVEDALSLHMAFQMDPVQMEQSDLDFGDIISDLDNQYDSIVSGMRDKKIRISELFSTESESIEEKKRTAPSVDEEIAEGFKQFIELEIGKIRGYIPEYTETSMAFHMSVYFMENLDERKEFMENNPEFESYEIEFMKYLDGTENTSENSNEKPFCPNKAVEGKEDAPIYPGEVLEDVEYIADLNEELLPIYIQALEHAQNANFDQAWQQLSDLDSSEQGYEKIVDTIGFYAKNRDSIE